MRAQEQQRILKILQQGRATHTSADAGEMLQVPMEGYTDPEQLALEQTVFFKQTPLMLGLSSDLPGINTYVATNETGVPILMTRDASGCFRAFLNICRHRGMQVVATGRGEGRQFSCPFHAWTYQNTGDLIAVTHKDKFGSLDHRDFGLTELPSAEVAGTLWVQSSVGEPLDPSELLGPLADEFMHWGLAQHPFRETQVIEADLNWKLAIDTFGENYHFNVLHRTSLATDIIGNLQTHDIFDRHYRMVFASKAGFEHVLAEAMPVENWPYRQLTLNVYFLFPNVIFLVDPAGIDVLRMYPAGNAPGRSRTHHSYYPQPDLAEMITESRFPGFNKIIVEEDYWAATSIQRNADAGVQTHGLFGRNEPALHHYHRVHRDALGLPALTILSPN
ncbi:MAG: aromatic ring-hydroxylating dioxygenase subunit alpha [Pseudomonadales bacterium]|nr:aromatic ring-hydroxylating dioxygenase subunit alpha [Pseudomonadales bacterium]